MARERYLVNVDETEMKPEEKRELTPAEKRKNFWYYNKWKFLLGALALVALIYFMKTVVFKTRPDYEVAFVIRGEYDGSTLSQLEEKLAQSGEDRNGDGKVVVELHPYHFYSSDTPGSMRSMVNDLEVTTDIDKCISILFITDQESFQSLTAEIGTGLFVDLNTMQAAPDGLSDDSALRVPYSEWKAFEGFLLADESGVVSDEYTEKKTRRLYLSLRTLADSRHEDSEKKIAYYEDSKKLLERILSGETASTQQEDKP